MGTAISGVDDILLGRYLGFWSPWSSLFSLSTPSEERDGPAKGEDRGVRGLRWGCGDR